MSIEQRKAKILINKAGGTAGADAKNYRVALPSAWINELGIDEESREVVLQFDGEYISGRYKSRTPSASCSIESESRKSAKIGCLSRRCALARLSWAKHRMGTPSNRARAFRALEIAVVASYRFPQYGSDRRRPR